MIKKKDSQSENNLLVKFVFFVASITFYLMLRPPYAKSGTGPRSNYTQPRVGTYATNGESSTQPCEPCVGTHATNGEISTQLSLSNNSGYKNEITKKQYEEYPIVIGYALLPGQEPAKDIIESTVLQLVNRRSGLNLTEDPEEIALNVSMNYQREPHSFQQNKKYLEYLEKVMNKDKEFTEAIILGFAIEDKKSMGTILHDGNHEGSPEQLQNLNLKLEEVKLILNYSEEDKRLRSKQNKMSNLEETLRIGKMYLLDRKIEREGGKKQSPKKPQFLVTKEKRGSR